MEKLIVMVFDDQTKALAGFELLRQLDHDSQISVYEAEIIAKESDGSIRYIDNTDKLGLRFLAGTTAVGMLVGFLGGPAGAAIGGATGGLIASIADLRHVGVTDEFANEVNAALTPGKFAVVADLSEDWVIPVNTQVERIGGVIFRRTRAAVKQMHHDQDVAAHQAEMDQLKAERAQARSDHLAKIDARIDAVRSKLEAALERDRRKMQMRQDQRDVKIRALKAKAEQSKGEVRRRLEARIAELRHDYDERLVRQSRVRAGASKWRS